MSNPLLGWPVVAPSAINFAQRSPALSSNGNMRPAKSHLWPFRTTKSSVEGGPLQAQQVFDESGEMGMKQHASSFRFFLPGLPNSPKPIAGGAKTIGASKRTGLVR